MQEMCGQEGISFILYEGKAFIFYDVNVMDYYAIMTCGGVEVKLHSFLN